MIIGELFKASVTIDNIEKVVDSGAQVYSSNKLNHSNCVFKYSSSTLQVFHHMHKHPNKDK